MQATERVHSRLGHMHCWGETHLANTLHQATVGLGCGISTHLSCQHFPALISTYVQERTFGLRFQAARLTKFCYCSNAADICVSQAAFRSRFYRAIDHESMDVSMDHLVDLDPSAGTLAVFSRLQASLHGKEATGHIHNAFTSSNEVHRLPIYYIIWSWGRHAFLMQTRLPADGM